MAQEAATVSAAAPAPAPRRTVLEVEVFVAGATTLLVLQLIFGVCRRRSSSIWIQGSVWLAYTLPNPLVTYTFGLMQSSQAKSELYPVWAISLFLVAGCSISVTAYDLDETKQWKKQLFELGQQYVYSGLIFEVLYPSHLSSLTEVMWTRNFEPMMDYCSWLLFIITLANLFRVVACWMATFSDPSKVVADYMRGQIDSGSLQMHQGSGSDPTMIEGGRYLVRWHCYFLHTHGTKANNYRTKLEPEDIITVDKIWEDWQDDRLFETNGASQPKDVCLAFALFRLMKRRYYGINCYEAGRPETRNFVLNGLLASEDGKRAFRIIEAELAFLHDFFFTKYEAIFENEISFFVMLVMKTVLIAILGVFVQRNILRIRTQDHIIRVEAVRVDTMITIAILGALLAVEIVQTILYLASDWALVSLACYYVRKAPRRAFMYHLLHKPIYMLRKLGLFNYWQHKIGQYSVIEGSRLHKSFPQELQPKVNNVFLFIVVKIQMLVNTISWKVRTCRYCRSIVGDVRLPDAVEREIASSLKATAHGPLTSGEASLERNGVLCRFSWTLQEDWDLTDIMLIWHIATNYCEEIPIVGHGHTAEATGLNTGKLRHYREVATRLSRYSAYLMNSVPELLPGNPGDTSFTFDKVMQEATEMLYQGKQDDTRGREMANRRMLLEAFGTLRSSGQDKKNGSIFFKGLKLGKQLEDGIGDAELRWKVMAEFWAEIFLYVAPSDNVRGHVEHLAKGGEFITHIWALLSHAGILTRPPRQLSSFLPIEEVSDTQDI